MAPPSIVVDGSAVDRRGWLRRPTPRLLRIGDSYQQFKPLELDRGAIHYNRFAFQQVVRFAVPYGKVFRARAKPPVAALASLKIQKQISINWFTTKINSDETQIHQ
jgi:hypothetical protein